ncbi:M23 family metallopeptidase [Candidatus Electronema sp. JM]|uniref:M23 family metallopeptidase n=1 Tax=Candidatus Electronema sp. JM TaxID=3401571 RepID=UPI003AA83204
MKTGADQTTVQSFEPAERRPASAAWRTLLLLLSALFLLAAPAEATQGNILAKGLVYQAATYIGHPKYGTHPSYYGNRPEQVVDINIGAGSDDDEGLPLFAPEDGNVAIIHRNTDAWGYSLEWRKQDGGERLFLAHLKKIVRAGAVRAGEKIAELGGTGGWKPHLHIESAIGWLELSGGIVIPPVNPSGNGMFVVSNGPADTMRRHTLAPPFVTITPQRQAVKNVTELGGGVKAAAPKRSGWPPGMRLTE